MWLECRFQDTVVDGSDPGFSMLYPCARHFFRIASVDSAVKWVPGGDSFMKGAQCYEFFGGIALRYHAFLGGMNIHINNPLRSLTKQILTTLSLYNYVQVINKTSHMFAHIIDWVIVRPIDDFHKYYTVTYSLESDHYCINSYFNVSVSRSSTIYRTIRNVAQIDQQSFNAELSSVSEVSSVVVESTQAPEDDSQQR